MDEIIKKLALEENVTPEELKNKISSGTVVIPLNSERKDTVKKPVAIGEGLTVKVNANIGASPGISSIEGELEKLRVSVSSGADTVMDLTIGEGWEKMLSLILRESPVPVGTVPIYGTICSSENIGSLSEDDFIRTIEQQARMGVDFMTIHAGVTRSVADIYDKSCRTGGIVSRGGKLIYRWMKKTGKENPFYSRFDDILDIVSRYAVTVSLGDGLRPGSIADASDKPQYAELEILGELTSRCRSEGVMVMVEGPGHVPLNKIKENVEKEKEICQGAPFYVLGPLTTDIAVGYDHITSAIGGAFAGYLGADFLCYVTPSEHLHLPGLEDVRQGVVASKIAAHSASIARGLGGDRDRKMSEARKNLDWAGMEKYALDGVKIKETRKKYPSLQDEVCTMCGPYCALLED